MNAGVLCFLFCQYWITPLKVYAWLDERTLEARSAFFAISNCGQHTQATCSTASLLKLTIITGPTVLTALAVMTRLDTLKVGQRKTCIEQNVPFDVLPIRWLNVAEKRINYSCGNSVRNNLRSRDGSAETRLSNNIAELDSPKLLACYEAHRILKPGRLI